MLLFGGGIALGRMLFDTGLAGRIGTGVITASGVQSELGLAGLGVAVAAIVSGFLPHILDTFLGAT